MPKIRASYSLLNAWTQGRIDEALLSYFHIRHETPWRYRRGKELDEYSQEYIKNNAKLPQEWGGDPLDDYQIQYKIKLPYNEMCDLVGVFDVYTPGIITELKSGVTSASEYASTLQIPIYLLLAQMSNLPVEYSRIIRYDPTKQTYDRAIIYQSDEAINKARNYIDSIVPEIYQYFEDHDLFRPEEEIQQRLTNTQI